MLDSPGLSNRTQPTLAVQAPASVRTLFFAVMQDVRTVPKAVMQDDVRTVQSAVMQDTIA